jgi:hypothetical protein
MIYLTDPKGAQFGLFKTDTDPSDATMVGQRFQTEDGNEVVLFQNGSVALVSGVLTQHSPIVANHQNIAVVTYTNVNQTTGTPATITATLGATVANANQYAGGLAVVNAGTGKGQTLTISESSATAASGVITLTLALPASVALDNTSKLDLIARPYTGVVIAPTTATASVSAVTLYPVPASVLNTYDGTSGALLTVGTYQYAFGVVRGVTSCLSDASVAAVGLGISRSTTTAGSITVQAATLASIGNAYQTSVSAENRAVFINL